ncbi:MAG TPA: 3'-5' exonuclease [Chitinophagaceae bacterium]|nr:3'-5' exonuclease [Chitinophagaceae bacterium]
MTNEQLKSILFIDIETVSIQAKLEDLSGDMQELWAKKARTIRVDNIEDADPARLFEDRGGIFSEFSKVVCIGVGYLVQGENGWDLRLKTLCENEEKVLLNQFIDLLARFGAAHKEMRFCGHNIKEFDLPFLCRRMIINGMSLPVPLQLHNKKPWEILHIDTLELWKFGDYKNFTSLALLAAVLGIPSPKEDIDGSMVGRVFWQDQDYARIATYCARDVLTTAKVFLRLGTQHDIQINPVYT